MYKINQQFLKVDIRNYPYQYIFVKPCLHKIQKVLIRKWTIEKYGGKLFCSIAEYLKLKLTKSSISTTIAQTMWIFLKGGSNSALKAGLSDSKSSVSLFCPDPSSLKK